MTNSTAGLALHIETVASQTPASAMVFSQAERTDTGAFPRVCRKGAEGRRAQRGHLTANPSQCGKLPETPAQTAESAWVTPREPKPRFPEGGGVHGRQIYTSVPLKTWRVEVR